MLQSDNDLPVSEMRKKKMGITDLISELKCVKSYPDFEKLAHVIQHGLQGFIVKNIEGESMGQTFSVIFCRIGSV